VQLFTVGTSSLEHLAAHQERLPSPYRLDASSAIQAKSATELLPLILAHPAGKVGRILVLRGDKSMESLQDGLRETSRTYTELTVYETSARPTLQRDISAILAQHDEGESMWLVFFSPSSAEMVIRTLTSTSGPQDRERGEQTNDPQEVCELEERRKEVLWTRFRVAAIGETTARYLVDRKISVEAVAKEPTAQGLLEAIQDNKSMRGDQREDTHRYRFK
jgi:uroporphyrinogen-III synthase